MGDSKQGERDLEAGWNANAMVTAIAPMAECIVIVYSPDGVHLAVAGPEHTAIAQVGEYVRSRAEHQLWPHQAVQLHQLLAQDRVRDAVEYYFARVGDRWDAEYLEVQPGDAFAAA